jgi:acyl carrier protein
MQQGTVAPSRQDISNWLVDWIGKEAELPAGEIDLDRSLLDYSLSSITATILVGDIEEWLEITLPPTLAWDYPTIGALVDFLAETVAGGHGG